MNSQKLGVYIASHKNAIFLRLCLLQLAAQTRRPDVVAVCENGHPFKFRPLVEDVLQGLESRGTLIRYLHSGASMVSPHFHMAALGMLLQEGCDLYTKFDHDDFFYTHHLAVLEEKVRGYDAAIGRFCEMLIQPLKGYGFIKPLFDFGVMNPTGGMSDACMFNRAFAEQYMADMKRMVEQRPDGIEDDYVMGKVTMPKFKVNAFRGAPTTCYVTHGANSSTPAAAVSEFERQQKENQCPSMNLSAPTVGPQLSGCL